MRRILSLIALFLFLAVPSYALEVRPGLVKVRRDMRSFGAVCDGSTNDATALQTAFSSDQPLEWGDYTCVSASQLTIPSGLDIKGNSSKTSILKQGANFTTGSFLSGNGVSNIIIEDLQINTVKATYTGTETALYLNSSTPGSDVVLNRLFINGSTSGGIAVDNTTRVRITNCDVTDTVNDAIRVASGTDVIVSNNNLYGLTNMSTTKRGIQIGASAYARVQGNTVKGVPSTAYAFDFGGSSYVEMIGNSAQGGAGVDLEGASVGISIVGNSFVGGTAAGNIGVYIINGTANIVNDVSITGNTFLNLFHGIEVDGHRQVSIGNNIFRNMYGSAIKVIQSGAVESDFMAVTGNLINACSLSGASTYPSIQYRTVSGVVIGNVVRGGSTTFDIQDDAANSNVQVAGNVVGASGYSNSAAYRKIDIWSTAFYEGNGTPEGAVAAKVGSIYRRLDGGAATTLYIKESGTGNTGWVGK